MKNEEISIILLVGVAIGFCSGAWLGNDYAKRNSFECLINWTTANGLNSVDNINNLSMCTLQHPVLVQGNYHYTYAIVRDS